MTYDFSAQLREGQACEGRVADWLATSGGRRSVQVKQDARSERTGRICIELVSVDTRGTPGWAYSCSADWLFIVQPMGGRGFWLRPGAIRLRIPRWEQMADARVRDYIRFRAPNDGYNTTGLCVPVGVVEALAVAVARLHG